MIRFHPNTWDLWQWFYWTVFPFANCNCPSLSPEVWRWSPFNELLGSATSWGSSVKARTFKFSSTSLSLSVSWKQKLQLHKRLRNRVLSCFLQSGKGEDTPFLLGYVSPQELKIQLTGIQSSHQVCQILVGFLSANTFSEMQSSVCLSIIHPSLLFSVRIPEACPAESLDVFYIPVVVTYLRGMLSYLAMQR